MAEQLEQMLFRSATAAAEMVRSGQISSRELTELALARIDALNPSLNAVVELRPEAALQGGRAGRLETGQWHDSDARPQAIHITNPGRDVRAVPHGKATEIRDVSWNPCPHLTSTLTFRGARQTKTA